MSVKRIILMILVCVLTISITQSFGINTEIDERFRATIIRRANLESWIGKAADQSGNNWCDFTGFTPLQVTSGISEWGTAIKVIGSDDTPHLGADGYFYIRGILIVTTTEVAPIRMRVLWGSTTSAQAITDNNVSEIMIQADVTSSTTGVISELFIRRLTVGTKVWMQSSSLNDAATIDFFLSFNEYELEE
jgi:hypothetical protein